MRFLGCLVFCFGLINLVYGQFDMFLPSEPDAVSEDEKVVVHKWLLLESRVKSLVDEAVKTLMPSAMGMMESLNVSRGCFRDGAKVLLALRKLKTWAVKFLDASAKSVDGILYINGASLGSYAECIENEVLLRGKVLFQGKYCTVNINPFLKRNDKAGFMFPGDHSYLTNLFPNESIFNEIAKFVPYTYYAPLKVGLCMPSSCSIHDLNNVLKTASEYFGVSVKASKCEIKEEKKITPLIVGVLTAYAAMGFLVFLGTMIDIYIYYTKKNFKNIPVKLLKAFSLISNFEKLTDTSSSLKTDCLHGMRFLSLSWVVLGHTYMLTISLHHNFPKNFADYPGELAAQVIFNGTFSVDTFFFLSGFLVCYATTRLVKIQKKPFNIYLYVIHRLWRIVPAYAFVIGYEFIKPFAGSGPMFNELFLSQEANCKANWWSNLIFINNYYNTNDMCLPHAWFMAVDMQLYLLALIVLVPLMRWPKIGISLAVSFIIGGMALSGVYTYVYGFPPLLILSESQNELGEFHRKMNMKPYFHGGPFFIGLLLGYLIALRSDFKIPKVVQVPVWSTLTAMCLTIVYGVQKWNAGVRPTELEGILFAVFARPAWGIALAWMTFCCCTANGGIVNYILSWKVWPPLSRLTYIAYLVHFPVMMSYHASLKQILHIEHYIAVWIFIGILVLSYGVALVGSMLVEAPLLALEKILLVSRFENENETPSTSAYKFSSHSENEITTSEKNVFGNEPPMEVFTSNPILNSCKL